MRVIRLMGTLGLMLALTNTVSADMRQVLLPVKGATNPANGTTTALRRLVGRLPAVRGVRYTMETPQVRIDIRPGHWPDVDQLQQRVREARLEPIPGGMLFRLTGRLQRSPRGLGLELDGMKTPTILEVVSPKDLATRLDASLGQRVALEGSWRPAAAGEPGPGTFTATTLLREADPSK